MARVNYSDSGSAYASYRETYYDDLYDSTAPEKALKALGVETKDKPGGNFAAEVKIADADGKFSGLFDKASHVKYIADSGD